MKKIIVAILLLTGQSVYADCATDLMPTFTAAQATQACSVFGSAIGQSLIPVTDNLYNLGSASLRWKELFLSDSLTSSAALITTTAPGGTTYHPLVVGTTAALAAEADLNASGSVFVSNPNTARALAILSNAANAGGEIMTFDKTRSTGTDANTIVVSGDSLGTILWRGAGGSAYQPAARLVVTVDGTPGASDMPGALDFQVTPDGSITPASALKISNTKAAVFAGTVTNSANDMGWSVVAGANTACTTTCTSACVFGVNTAATEADIVNCADATADECMCAGAS